MGNASITAKDAVPQTADGPVVCESTPAQSTAHVKATDSAGTDIDANAASVFENQPRKSVASIAHDDTAHGAGDGPSVFESRPETSQADAAHGIEGAESGSEWETDSEAN